MCWRISSHSGLRSLPSTSGVGRRPTRARVRVDDRELDLVLVGAEVDEQLVRLVDDLRDARVGPVDLVDDEDHRQVRFERLAQHEARLRQRPFARVDEQEHAVDHREPALDLAAEVGVTGRVDDVERDVAVPHRGVLGEDRDALLALEVVRVHHALGDVLVGAEGSGLPQQTVDERGLAVIDVRDDRDVAQVGAYRHQCQASAGPSSRSGLGAAAPRPRSASTCASRSAPDAGCTHVVGDLAVQRCALPRTAPRRRRAGRRRSSGRCSGAC